MQCILCESFFAEETRFFNLFTFKNICPTCEEEYRPKATFEWIPIDFGYLIHHYLYPENLLNKRQRDILMQHFYILFQEVLISKQSRDVMLIVDDEGFEVFTESLPWILGFRCLLVISLVRQSFEDLMFFY